MARSFRGRISRQRFSSVRRESRHTTRLCSDTVACERHALISSVNFIGPTARLKRSGALSVSQSQSLRVAGWEYKIYANIGLCGASATLKHIIIHNKLTEYQRCFDLDWILDVREICTLNVDVIMQTYRVYLDFCKYFLLRTSSAEMNFGNEFNPCVKFTNDIQYIGTLAPIYTRKGWLTFPEIVSYVCTKFWSRYESHARPGRGRFGHVLVMDNFDIVY